MENYNVSFSLSCDEKAKTISKIAPYSKVLFLTIKKENEQKIKLINACKILGLKIITVYLESNFSFSVDNVCELFNMPEDVRIIMTDECTLIDTVKYVSKIKNVPSIFMLDHIVNGMFCHKVFIRNGCGVDVFCADGYQYFILNNQIDAVSLYRTAMFYPICLIDILARSKIINATYNKLFFDLKRTIIKLVQSLLLGDNDNALTFILHIERIFSKKQELLNQSSAFIAKTILGGYDSDTFTSLLNYTAKYYFGAFSTKSINCDDYAVRAKDLSFIANVKPLTALKWIKRQLEILDCKTFNIDDIKHEVKSIYSLFLKLVKEYKRLGGVIKEPTYIEKRAIELSGDTMFGLNFFTLYRECVKI